jgi:hypothetical protein
VLPVDLAEPEGADQVLAWLDDRAIVLDGLVLVQWADTDPARAQQLAAQLDRLERTFGGRLHERGFGPPVRLVDERRAPSSPGVSPASRPAPSRPAGLRPAEPRRRASVRPPGSTPIAAPTASPDAVQTPASRGRASTRPGHADPSERPRSFTPIP